MKTKTLDVQSDQTDGMLENNGLQTEAGTENIEQLYPLFFRSSGLYVKSPYIFKPNTPILPLGTSKETGDNQSSINLDILDAEEKEEFKIHPFFKYEELRLDIDGRYPLMMASGHLRFPNVHYIAKLKRKNKTTYIGKIWYKYGNVASFPYTAVKITISNSFYPGNKKVKVVFTGGSRFTKTSTYKYKSKYYDKVNFEYDCEQGVSPVLEVNTFDHPNRPGSIVNENLKLGTIYQRSGFNVSRSGDNTVPSALKGANGKWSDSEMHDAMLTYWSKFNNAPKWAMWVFFAKQHDIGPTLGGIMFDDIGPNHRQGTAIFNDSFINNPPAGDPSPAAAVRRLKFWTAVHEMGHGFNLAHSWQKNYPSFGNSWIPLANEPEARSFMNYPYNVSGGQAAFFANFEYRFSNNELLFLRHAPRSFVQMGNSQWFHDHGFENEVGNTDNRFNLEVHFNKPSNLYEYMEPVYVQLKLKNTSGAPLAVDQNILKNLKEMLIRIEKPSGDFETIKSFVHYMFQEKEVVLMPDEYLSENHFISAGTDGWYIKDRGTYKVSAVIGVDEALYASKVSELDVLSPYDMTQEIMGANYFTEEVGRILYFNGSRFLDEGNAVLEEVVKNSPDTNAAIHAAVALAQPYLNDYKTLEFDDPSTLADQRSAGSEKAGFKTKKANKTKAMDYLAKATANVDRFVESFGSSRSDEALNSYVEILKSGDKDKASKVEKAVNKALKNRSGQ